MNDKLDFTTLQKALEKINKWCNHKPVFQINQYWKTCRCGKSNFLTPPQELIDWYNKVIKTSDETPIEEIFGIKIIGTNASSKIKK